MQKKGRLQQLRGLENTLKGKELFELTFKDMTYLYVWGMERSIPAGLCYSHGNEGVQGSHEEEPEGNEKDYGK